MVLAVGTRLQDFTTGSWSLFADDARFIGLNAARFDARKHQCAAGGRRRPGGLDELGQALHGWQAPEAWLAQAQRRTMPSGTPSSTSAAARPMPSCRPTPMSSARSTAWPTRATWRSPPPAACRASCACAGGPSRPSTFDCEFGFSCMGYEIAGGWGAKLADPVARRDRHGRRRQLPDDEQRHLQLGADRPEADRRRLRQWRLRRDRPAAARQGHPVVQQPAGRHAATWASWSGSTSPSTPRSMGAIGDHRVAASASSRTRSAAPRPPTAPRSSTSRSIPPTGPRATAPGGSAARPRSSERAVGARRPRRARGRQEEAAGRRVSGRAPRRHRPAGQAQGADGGAGPGGADAARPASKATPAAGPARAR